MFSLSSVTTLAGSPYFDVPMGVSIEFVNSHSLSGVTTNNSCAIRNDVPIGVCDPITLLQRTWNEYAHFNNIVPGVYGLIC